MGNSPLRAKSLLQHHKDCSQTCRTIKTEVKLPAGKSGTHLLTEKLIRMTCHTLYMQQCSTCSCLYSLPETIISGSMYMYNYGQHGAGGNSMLIAGQASCTVAQCSYSICTYRYMQLPARHHYLGTMHYLGYIRIHESVQLGLIGTET